MNNRSNIPDLISNSAKPRHTRLKKILGVLVVLAIILGCTNSVEQEVASISIRSGDGQCGFQNQEVDQKIVVELLGPKRSSTFSSAVSHPVPAVKIAVEPLHKTANAGFKAEYETETTDSAGIIRFHLTLGNEFGDQYYKIYCPDFPHVKPAYLHAVAGVKIINNNQEVFAGNETPRPVTIAAKRLADNGEYIPLTGLPIYVNQNDSLHQATLAENQFLTDENGEVSLKIKTNENYTGSYDFSVEMGDGFQYKNADMNDSVPAPELRSRGIAMRVLAISNWNVIIAVLGGLAIFIFGMTLMSHGLQQIAGDKLKSLLQLFTGNRFKAVLAGTVITSLIQSSSATTVMVVGFVNAGLLYLSQAIGIIYGAAIGTTISAQMISLKLDGMALPAICIGVTLLLIAHKDNWKGIGNTILGFGMLFYGMILMSSEMKVLANFPSFMSFFNSFDCSPVNGHMPFGALCGTILVGTVLTVIVQSSAATVGMTLALADAGLINFYTGVPLILGDNIGTTITGILASISTSRASKQTAIAATIFKVLGVLVMIPLFFINWNGQPCFLELINKMTAGNPFSSIPENMGRHLANSHTIFNILSVIVFLPFTQVVASLARFIIPDKQENAANKRLCFLETHLLNLPSAALDQVVNALTVMTREAITLTQKATCAFLSNDTTAELELKASENKIDGAQKDIIDYLVKLTRRNLSETQSSTIPIFMHCVNDVERIGDRAINIYDLIKEMPKPEDVQMTLFTNDKGESNTQLSDKAKNEITEILNVISLMADMLISGLQKNDTEVFNKIIQKNVEVEAMTSRFELNHEARLQKRDCTVQKGIVFVEILANLERIAAHLNNLAERARDMAQHRVSFEESNKKHTNH